MDSIVLKDKTFVPYLDSDRIKESISAIAKNINSDLADDNPLFLVVLNGSFIFAADLLRNITIPCEVSFIKLNSYAGTHSNGDINELIGLKEEIKDRLVVIVEDIVDTGHTIEHLKELLVEKEVKDIKIASLLFKPDAYLKSIPVDYIGIEILNYFVVGYGLDYDGLGRNLNAIYKLKE